MTARTQVNSVLVIRTRDEATKAVKAIGSALAQLTDTRKKVAAGSETAASGMQQILGVLASLDNAYAKTAESDDAGAAARERQNRAIASSNAQYSALGRLNHPDTDQHARRQPFDISQTFSACLLMVALQKGFDSRIP